MASEGRIPTSCEVFRFDESGVELRLGSGSYDSHIHGEGVDIKAVTYHAARFEPNGAEWRAQVIFDV
jgi:SHS2 domain-containing protein